MTSKFGLAAVALAAALLAMPVSSAQAGFHKELDCLFGWMRHDHGTKVVKKKHKKHMKKAKMAKKMEKKAAK